MKQNTAISLCLIIFGVHLFSLGYISKAYGDRKDYYRIPELVPMADLIVEGKVDSIKDISPAGRCV